MITPNDVKQLELNGTDFEALENKIDKEIKRNHGTYEWEEAILDEELPIAVRDELSKRAMKAGWNYVYHGTSSENGERPGLTSFIFSETEVEHLKNNNTYHKFSKSDKLP